MPDLSPVDWWRIFYIAFALVALVLMFHELTRNIREKTDSQKYLRFALLGLIAATILAALESLYFEDRLSIRTPLITACIFWCFLALRADRKARQNKGV